MSPRPRRDQAHDRPQMEAAIKAAARREMGITAPAIYNYFPRLEDLITALIVESFAALADSMDAAGAVAGFQPAAKIRATVVAYRRWAVEHPVDFQLLYGNPIPGYVAPFDLTAPLARRPFLPLFSYFWQAYQAGELVVPVGYQAVPPHVAGHVAAWKARTGLAMPEGLFCAILTGWSRIHGLVLLELTHHIQPMIGDAAEFFEYEVDAFLDDLGMAVRGDPGTETGSEG
jgi:AcrR family transcriptional regulator